ncbi:MAG: dihydrodipicolinate synthase family protein [Chloroflexi bacterium]|nr:dihydrodipicolinate synthase family protein [Chloroflexota bacterium]
MGDSFAGVHWMLVTPFDEQERVDAPAVSRLVHHAAKAGCAGVVALGEMGEWRRLTDHERRAVLKRVRDAADGRLPVTVGVTSLSTFQAVNRAREARELGASALMAAPPPMSRPNLVEVQAFYQRLAEAVDLPLVVQDYPQVTGVALPATFFAQLAEAVPSFRYIKLEDPPTPPKITQIRRLVPEQIGVFGGLGGVYLLSELERGAMGAMTGFAFPEVLVKVCRLAGEGAREEAAQLYCRYLPLVLYEGQEGIGLSLRKHALLLRGLIGCARVRHPGPNVDEPTRQELHTLIRHLGLSTVRRSTEWVHPTSQSYQSR